MQELNRERIKQLRLKMLEKEIILLSKLYHTKNDIIFVKDDELTLSKLNKIYNLSSRNEVSYIPKCNNKLFYDSKDMISINWNESLSGFFSFYKERIQVILPTKLLIENIDNILDYLLKLNNDVLIYSESLNHGVSILRNEYEFVYSKW